QRRRQDTAGAATHTASKHSRTTSATKTPMTPATATTDTTAIDALIAGKQEPGGVANSISAQLQFPSMLSALSPALAATSSVSSGSPATAYILGHHSPLAGGSSSPALSMSSAMGNGGGECLGLSASTSAPLGSSPVFNGGGNVDCLAVDSLVTKEWLVASTQGLMFPSLPTDAAAAAGQYTVGRVSANDGSGSSSGSSGDNAFAAAVAAASTLQLPNVAATADAAAIDGWLQQYVNADALDHMGNLTNSSAGAYNRSTPPAGPFTFGTTCPGSILAVDASPQFSYASPEYSPPNTTFDLLDQSAVAVIAAAMSEPLSSDMLASMFSSAANVDIHQALAESIGHSNLLPLTGLATPMTNIAPQKTLSSVTSSPPLLQLDQMQAAAESQPPSKKQKRPVVSASRSREPKVAAGADRKIAAAAAAENDKNIAFENMRFLGSNAAAAAKTISATASMASAAPQTSASGSSPRSVPGNASNRGRPLAPSPPRSSAAAASGGANGSRHMVPLAPRQPSQGRSHQQQQQQHKRPIGIKPENASQATSRSGSNTPPGLGVLAKIAQKQVPIQVKSEEEPSAAPMTGSTGSQQKLRPIAQARPSSANMQPQPIVAKIAAAPAISASIASQADSIRQSSPEETTADTAAQKRQERLIKNRAAALLSRKRKREYMSKLEADVEELRESNSSLLKRLEEMERRLGQLTAERDQLLHESHTARVGAASGSASSSPQQENGAGSNGSGSGTCTSASSSAEASTAPEKQDQKPQQPQPPQQQQQNSDSMEVDDCNDNSHSKGSGVLGIHVPFSSAFVSDSLAKNSDASAQSEDDVKRVNLDTQSRTVRPNVSTPVGAPKAKRQSESQLSAAGNKKQPQQQQRTAGALLMAVLFSFSLFTLPSLYTSDKQISTGGTQSAGILPVRSLPPIEPRLLISDSVAAMDDGLSTGVANSSAGDGYEAPLIERVRRSITALARQIDGSQEMVGAGAGNHSRDAARDAGGSASRVDGSSRMRPMTMEESMGLRAWINTGLLAASEEDSVVVAAAAADKERVDGDFVHQIDGQELSRSEMHGSGKTTSSLSLVRQGSGSSDDNGNGGGMEGPSSVNRVARPLDYAMLYCPTMQHVLFGGDMLDVADMRGAASGDHSGVAYRPNAEARVIHADRHPGTKIPSSRALVPRSNGRMDDVDEHVPRSVGDATVASLDLVPTQAGKHLRNSRPKMSFYSPVAVGGDGHEAAGGILAPWEEYARMADAEEKMRRQEGRYAGDGGSSSSSRQKYLRIDVEVVGSRWVTADKFAHGLY
ncbi:hypothetical protein LPJ75_001506, partial [Coemansia sp. RSA 2598]